MKNGDFRILSITNISTANSRSVGASDGIEIRGQEFAASGFPTGGVRVGYIFFTGSVKLSAPSGGVTAGVRGTINSFYSRTVSNRPYGDSFFVGNAPAEGTNFSTFEFNFKCYDLSVSAPGPVVVDPVKINVVTSILNIILDE